MTEARVGNLLSNDLSAIIRGTLAILGKQPKLFDRVAERALLATMKSVARTRGAACLAAMTARCHDAL